LVTCSCSTFLRAAFGFAEGNSDALDAPQFGGALAGRRDGLAIQQCIGDGVNLADQTPGEGTEQGRNLDPGINFDRDDQLAFLDAGIGGVPGLGADPRAFQGVFGEDDNRRAGLFETGVDGGDDVVAGRDLPAVPPAVDTTLAKVFS
jgi:hypothetical protein